jgi:hypothetical protein
MRDKDGEDQIRRSPLISGRKFRRQTAEQQRGDALTAKSCSKSRGCLACHSIGEATTRSAGLCREPATRRRKGKLRLHRALDSQPARTLGALLSERKARSDAEDYAKNNLPFVFDTELHSRCPNDGAELQVQNMTVMPNFRLSERTRATSPLICSRFRRRRSYADASFMDEPRI